MRASLRSAVQAAGYVWLAFLGSGAVAQTSISPSGQASYAVGIPAPPGISGMAPNLSLSYVDGGTNGPLGAGWSVQGISTISRCGSSRVVDGAPRAVDFTGVDKLCLDGQRLIQTDAGGNPLPAGSQVNDALGLAGDPSTTWREYRTEKDNYARIRAYGSAGTDATFGPSYFKVWTKSGQIYEYGTNPGGAPSQAQILGSMVVAGVTRTPVIVWAVSRISDVTGNYIDFKYTQRRVAWGSGIAAGGDLGTEWNLAEVQYTGAANGQVPHNKIVFTYIDRPADALPGYDRAEAYQFSQKNVSLQLLQAVRTYVNSPNPGALGPAAGAVAVKVLKLGYERSPSSGRSRLITLTECAGANESKCLPATRFAYGNSSAANFIRNTALGDAGSGLRYLRMADATGNYGVLTGDFDGDGRTDIIRWSTTASLNQLWRSTGGGGFAQQGAFNLGGQQLFTTDGCYTSSVADVNGDGLSDILRVVKPSCGATPSLLFLSNGNGTFSTVTMPAAIDFSQIKATTSSTRISCIIPRGSPPVQTTGNTRSLRPQVDDYGPPVPASVSENLPIDGNCWMYRRTQGKRYYMLDANGDGLMDIVTTIAPSYSYADYDGRPSDSELCFGIGGCSKVFLGSTSGAFTEKTDANIKMASLYSDPPVPSNTNPYWRQPQLADINGDGLQDILSQSGRWRSLGDGNFASTAVQDSSQLCGMPIDFNGDGRADCLRPESTSTSQNLTVSYGASSSAALVQFNLTAAGDNLYGTDANARQNVGLMVDDFDGDGRQDILRWGPAATDNGIYFSRGDGSFRPRAGSGFQSIARPLQSADGATTFITGDFLGTGSMQVMHLKDNPPASGGTVDSTNQLYQRDVYAGPIDALATVLSPTGLLTTIGPRVSLVNSNGRYLSERGTAQAGTGNVVDLQAPMYVVTSLQRETDAGTLTTEYLYKGLKAERGGRGLLGFREMWQQNPAPGGEALTIASQFLLQHPYDGVTAVTQTYRGNLQIVGLGTPLSTTTNIYCDATSAASPDSATSTAPCSSASLIKRPYLRRSIEEGRDLNGAVLPKVTTTNTYNGYGDPTLIQTLTEASFAGAARQYLKTTTNTFCAPDTAGCPNTIAGNNWILGRLTRAEVSSSVPNLLSTLTASAGTSPTATAITGSPPSGSTPLVNPAVLSTILQLLLED